MKYYARCVLLKVPLVNCVIVKFHRHGNGNAKGAKEYLLGKDGQREGARVIRGDVNLVTDLANSLKFKQRYTSGVLSFEEPDISEALKSQIINDFEEALFIGLPSSQRGTGYWVEHTDKGRLELNFVYANVELESGKKLNPYYGPSDRGRIDAWKNAINAEHGFSDPNDPLRKRLSVDYTQFNNKNEIKAHVNQALTRLVRDGLIKNREDVVHTLQQAGFEITRDSKKSISVRPAGASENSQPIRLTGGIYERNAQFSEATQSQIEAASRIYERERAERAERARERYTQLLERKRGYHQRRYKPSHKTIQGQPQRATSQGIPFKSGAGIFSFIVGSPDNVLNDIFLQQNSHAKRIRDNYAERRAHSNTVQRARQIAGGRGMRTHVETATNGVNENDRARTANAFAVAVAYAKLRAAVQHFGHRVRELATRVANTEKQRREQLTKPAPTPCHANRSREAKSGFTMR